MIKGAWKQIGFGMGLSWALMRRTLDSDFVVVHVMRQKQDTLIKPPVP
jgi:hypothetical protein